MMKIYSTKVNKSNRYKNDSSTPSFSGNPLRTYPPLITNMLRYGNFTCPCCGEAMLNWTQHNVFRNELNASSTTCLVDVFSRSKEFIRGGIRPKVRDELLYATRAHSNEKMSLFQVAFALAEKHLSAFKEKNLNVLLEASKFVDANILDKSIQGKILKYFESAMLKIALATSNFERNRFLIATSNHLQQLGIDKATKDALFVILKKMPKPSTDISAFFVKNICAKAAPQEWNSTNPASLMDEFVWNLYSGGISTADHVRPLRHNGRSEVGNLLPMCGEDNDAKGKMRMSEYIKKLTPDKFFENLDRFFAGMPHTREHRYYVRDMSAKLYGLCGF